MTRAPQTFDIIQCGRAVAALMVVLYHASRIVALPRFYGDATLAVAMNNFIVGVDFFFVLSGFIITWAHWGDMGRPECARSYLSKRFLRIFPPYWGILLPLILLYALVPTAGTPSQHDPWNILLSVALLPNPQHPVLGVAWTLTYEIFFYALFLSVIRFGRNMLWGTIPWAIGIAIVQGDSSLFPIDFVFNAVNIDFIFGIWAAMLLRLWRHIPYSGLLLTLGITGFTLPILLMPQAQDHIFWARLIFGSSSMLIVIGAVGFERHRTMSIPAPILLVGAASYAIYLIHPVILSVSTTVLVRSMGRAIPMSISVALIFAASVLSGIIYHLILEKRLIAGMRLVLAGLESGYRNLLVNREAKDAV